MRTTLKIMDKKLNLDQIEGKYSAFARVPYALPVRISKPLAENGYGKVYVNDIEVPNGTYFFMDVIIKMHCLLIPVGSVANEYDKSYKITFKDFIAYDGTPFMTRTYNFKTLPRSKKNPKFEKNDEVALCAAREGIVLLKNENNVLPLDKNTILNCFGSAQFMFRNTSTGASLIKPRWQANFHQSIEEHSTFKINQEISKLYRGLKDIVPSPEQLKKAKSISDVALLIISRTSGEFLDNKPIKGGYYLTDDERALIREIVLNFEKIIVILNTGYPIEMGWVEEFGIDSVIYTGFAGQASGYALMEILDGRTNPSGKLSDSFALDYYDYPSAHNFINFSENDKVPGEKDKGVVLYYEEDIYVGYRYFNTFNKNVAFCFGHGLSYTNFELSIRSVFWSGKEVNVEVICKNVGNFEGKEVIQLYIEAPEGTLEKPIRVLSAFEKTKLLHSGESQTIILIAKAESFSSFNEITSEYLLEKGVYTMYCGNSLGDSKNIGNFFLSDEIKLRKVRPVNPPLEEFHKITKASTEFQCESKMVDFNERISSHAKRLNYDPNPLPKYNGRKITFKQLKASPQLLDSFVSQMTVSELCRLNVCGGANWYLPWDDGSAGKTVPLLKYGLPSIRVSDGNTGLNLSIPNIGFPSSTVIASTFNKDIAFLVGKTIGEESKDKGISVNLGPGMNIHRNILNGRHPEYFSEDPVLAGIMAGYHGKGLIDSGVGCTYKHLFCNNSDTSRKGSHSLVSQRALREIYYKVFEIAIDIQMPTCLMTSYNAVNGIYPAENVDVLQNLVRKEWNFKGFIMTDWGTYDTVSPVEMVKAGNCWLTEGHPKYSKILLSAVQKGELKRSVLENNVRYLVEMVMNSK